MGLFFVALDSDYVVPFCFDKTGGRLEGHWGFNKQIDAPPQLVRISADRQGVKVKGSKKILLSEEDFARVPKVPALQLVPQSPAVPHDPYQSFHELDGSHPFQRQLPEGYVSYQVRTRPGAQVFYFNFSLAKEMGLIPENHPHQLTPALRRILCQTFSLQIINEYDLTNKTKFQKQKIKKNHYMATRYLQLQHPDKRGLKSGDGRGIWNGSITRNGKTWDVTSSGTGATRLSPATSIEGKFFKTGDRNVGYGDGYNRVDDGLSTALMSEIFHLQGIATERTLVILSFKGGTSINVRAGNNLLRPSHLFLYLKQGRPAPLRRALDLLLEREIRNQRWPKALEFASNHQKYTFIAEAMAERFGLATARFREDYIFCWLDWDGDNILCDAGIIDYGSVRRFGAYHRAYRYDDVDRFSTSVSEQRLKGRAIVQTFIQMRDFLCGIPKRSLKALRQDPILKKFDRIYEQEFKKLRLLRAGFADSEANLLIERTPTLVDQWIEVTSRLENIQTSKGTYKVSDGVTSDPWINLRRCLAQVPGFLSQLPKKDLLRLRTADLLPLYHEIKTSYCRPRDERILRSNLKLFKSLLVTYSALTQQLALLLNIREEVLIRRLSVRAQARNPKLQVTGDGILLVTQSLLRASRQRKIGSLQTLIEAFYDKICGLPRSQSLWRPEQPTALSRAERKALEHALHLLQTFSEGF